MSHKIGISQCAKLSVAILKIFLSLLVSTARPDVFRELIQSIFTYDWKCDKIVTVAFVNLLGHIVSSNVTYLLPILQMLVKSFAPVIPGAVVTPGNVLYSSAKERLKIDIIKSFQYISHCTCH